MELRFDNIGYAVETLFECATFEGWLGPLDAALDSTGVGKQPVFMNRPAAAAFFVAFLLIGGFFVMNVFTGVVIDNYNRLKDRMTRKDVPMLSDDEQMWLDGLQATMS